jgi:iron complex outermembrane receptor protein
MSSRPPILAVAVRRALVCSAVVAAASAGVARAQQPATTAATSTLDEVVVTGSRIARTDAETASPVVTLSREDLEKTGQQNLSDIVRSISAEGQGTLPTSFTAGFASGASSVSLRGLGVNATLVLLNGRRLAPYGLADDGTRVFTDLNTLPLEAVDRVEVLKDGASSLYGSDAIAGVVNVILRHDYQGANVVANVGTSYRDDGTEGRVAGTFGVGNLASDRYNVYVTAEAQRAAAIGNASRPGYLGTENLTPWGYFDNRAGSQTAGRAPWGDGSGPGYQTRTPYGTVRVPGSSLFDRVNLTSCPEVSQLNGFDGAGNPIRSNICLWDDTRYNQIQPKIERYNVYARGTYDFSEQLEAYAELGWAQSKTTFTGIPTGFDDSGPKYCNTSATFVCDPTIITLPAGHPDNPYPVARALRYRAVDFGGRNGTNDSQLTRFVTGLKGSLSTDWSWEVGAGYVESKLKTDRTGFVRGSVLQAAIDAGQYRVNNPGAVSAATYAAISPTLETAAKNTLTLLDANLSGRFLDLPGGKLGLAIGAEWRKEKTDSPPTPFTDTGDIIGLGYSAFSSDRKVYAGYLELDAPVLASVEINAAVRYDHYSDYGSSTTPKVGLKFKPFKQLALRGTYSQGFRAPGPAEAGTSASFGFTNIGILSIGNPKLQPEKSKNYTFGVVFEPLDGMSASVDYYDIKRRNEITQADQAAIVAGLPTSGQPPNSQRPGAVPGSVLYYDQDGNLGTIAAPYANANQTQTSGLDFDLRQRIQAGDLGTFTARLEWTYILKFRKELQGGTTFDYVGTQGPYVLSSATGTPRNRGNLEVSWSRSNWILNARVNYVGSMKLIDHQGESLVDNGDGTVSTTTGEGSYFAVGGVNAPVCGVYTPAGLPFHHCESGSFLTFDLSGKLSPGQHVEVTASIRNLFNRTAPLNPYTYGGQNYNPAWTQDGAIGRFLTVGARYTF